MVSVVGLVGRHAGPNAIRVDQNIEHVRHLSRVLFLRKADLFKEAFRLDVRVMVAAQVTPPLETSAEASGLTESIARARAR